LIPKLYRYLFDLQPRLKDTVKSVWRNLIEDHKKAVDENFAV
jgi:hypothetical protein